MKVLSITPPAPPVKYALEISHEELRIIRHAAGRMTRNMCEADNVDPLLNHVLFTELVALLTKSS
jgi:hypothetical protein